MNLTNFHFYVFLLFGWVSLVTAKSFGQFSMENYSVNDGLPSPEVYFIHQDYDGFLWICGDRGLSRYNGYEFENFNLGDDEQKNTVFKIYEDKNHDLWMTCSDGTINILDYSSKEFKPFFGNEILKSFPEYNTWPSYIGLTDSTVEVTISWSHGSIFSSLYSFNRKDSSFIQKKALSDTVLEYDNLIVTVFDSLIEITQTHYLFHTPIYKQKNQDIIDSNVLNSRTENFFIVDSMIITHDRNKVMLIRKDTTEFKIPGRITNVCKDREDNYWVSTLSNGIYKVSSLDFFHTSLDELLKKDEKIASISSLGNHILIGSDLGKYFGYNTTTNVITTLIQDSYYSYANYMSTGDSILSQSLLFYLANNEIQIIDRKDPKLSLCFPANLNKLNDNTYIGSYHKNIVTSQSTAFKYPLPIFYKKRNQRIKTIDVIHGANVYYTTKKGLHLIDSLGRETNLSQQFNLGNTFVRKVQSFQDSLVIFATYGKGLLIQYKDSLFSVNESNGLVSNIVNDIVVDNNNDIWCTTNKGISKLELINKQLNEGIQFNIENFTHKNGLSTNYFEKLICHDSTIWTFEPRQLIHFNSNISAKNEALPKVHLISLTCNEIPFENGAEFEYNQNNLLIQYVGLSSNKPVSNDFYSYRIERNGEIFDKQTTNNRSVSFPELPSGEFTFSLSARTQYGDWVTPKTISFYIHPHWSELWGFKLLILILILIGISFIIKWRLAVNKKELNKKLELEQLENKLKSMELDVLRGQMNPHLIYNALNSAQSLMIQDDKLKATEFVNRLSKLLRSSLEYSREEFISIEDEIQFLNNYLEIELQRFPNRFNHTIHAEDELLDEFISPLIIQPLVENSVKHAFEGKKINIEIKFKRLSNDYYQVQLSDDGKGFNPDNQKDRKIQNTGKSSLGLVILKRRITILKDKFKETSYQLEYLDPKNKKGTKITLVLPVVE